MLEIAGAYAFRAFLNVLYLPMRLISVKEDKVSIFSRQSSDPSIDVELLAEELKRQNPDLEIAMITKRDNGGIKGSMSMIGAYVKSLYHMATSKVCVLESYWPPISVCPKRPGTKVVQMWHSIGKVKQSGLVAAGRPGGRSEKISRAMRMHEGYDFVIAGAPAWNDFYIDSFGCDESVIRNVGLPRIDHLVNDKDKISEEILKKHPDLMGKQVILYAPTFRRTGKSVVEGLIEVLSLLDKDKYAVIVKAHPSQEIDLGASDILTCPDVSAVDLLTVADYLITDYSAIALEGASLDVNTFYYVPDYDEYEATTGLNIDIRREMQGCVFSDAKDLADALTKPYPKDALASYKEKFLFDGIGSSARAICDIIFDEAGASRCHQ